MHIPPAPAARGQPRLQASPRPQVLPHPHGDRQGRGAGTPAENSAFTMHALQSSRGRRAAATASGFGMYLRKCFAFARQGSRFVTTREAT